MENEKILALMKHLDISTTDQDQDSVKHCAVDISVSSRYRDDVFEVGNEQYMVLTDEEADAEWEIELDRYLDECIYPELEDHVANYFDDEKWKNDARHDGRGHSLGSYDGYEYEVAIGETFYYIYRIN